MWNPWYKTTYHYEALGTKLALDVPHDVFSTQNIDEGTLLLLNHLPDSTPSTILDMGCGYGALGLPIAARYPDAALTLVDRDLLAAEWSKRNAEKNTLKNVDAYGSLGFQNLKSETQKFDWILCNVPARIGNPFIQNLMELGSQKLNPGGELRIVVIRDLGPVLLEMKAARNWDLEETAKGPRHTIFTLRKPVDAPPLSAEELYLRDEVTVQNLKLKRPFDFGGDDQKRLKSGLPVLIDALPRQIPQNEYNVFCFRTGYGHIALLSRTRWPKAKVVVSERDLIASTFLRINAEELGLEENLEIREFAHFPDAFQPDEKFHLILGEISPSAGESVALIELLSLIHI